uniref:Peptidyl-prolyl cis-trans isomerase n=1 Tax=Mycena chlorophos TaxID=658473 RepID=A0ABQ0MC38_MYCCL|nr:predicted protein [Mycena chlorophos]
MDWSVGDQPLGRVIYELFDEEAPKTCANFKALCTGERGLSSAGIPLYYKNSISHRIIANFMLQAGDFTKRNGQGGESIYGPLPFEDENLVVIDAPGLLCMANKGPNTNGSQFFITLRECPHLNGKHTVFGRVIRGYDEVVLKLGDVPVDEKSRPLTPVTITNCGELELRKVARPPSPSSEEGEEDERESRRRRRKSKRTASEESERRHRKKAKKEKRRKEKEASPEAPPTPAGTRQETEEEYDARLEREENERIAEQRRKELQRMKERHEREAQENTGGVRYKGRGRMMYRDPETGR